MTNSGTGRQQRRTFGLAATLLTIATLGLAVAWSALGQEVLSLPENRREAAEITARLPGLRAERDGLIGEVAALKAELASLTGQAESAAAELRQLRAGLADASSERDRLAGEATLLKG